MHALAADGSLSWIGCNQDTMNLLDNSDFRNPVEQAGRGGLHGTQKYAIDRWALESGASAWGNRGEDMVILSDKTNWIAGIYQIIDATLFERDKVYTIAVYGYIPNECRLYAYSGAVGFGVEYFEKKSAWTVYTCEITIPSSYEGSAIKIMISTDTSSEGGTTYLRWAALYEGSYTADTLPPYVPKGYAQELAECQRYFYRYSGKSFLNKRYDDYQTTTIPFKVTMRTAPSITDIIGGAAAENVTPEAVQFGSYDGQIASIDAFSAVADP